jgi:mannose-1-phosphate guanylyltransferase/mannose-6-phosphate isomerase
MKIIPVILCGGSGTRLWPLSHRGRPKQFLELADGGASLLQQTARRFQKIARAGPIVTVCLEAHAAETCRHLAALDPALACHILREPQARNTAAACALAAHYVRAHFGGDALMLITPADHHIGNEAILAEAVARAAPAAEAGYVALLGIPPARAETGYGYIAPGEALPFPGLRGAWKFMEKPEAAVAEELVRSGAWLWNSGIYFARADAVLAAFARFAPEIARGATPGAEGRPCPRLYAAIPAMPFEKAVIEKLDTLAVAACGEGIGWSDVGSWASLWEGGAKDADGNVRLAGGTGRIFSGGAQGCLIRAGSRPVACIGVRDLIVVDTEEGILVADRRDGDALRALAKEFRFHETATSREGNADPRFSRLRGLAHGAGGLMARLFLISLLLLAGCAGLPDLKDARAAYRAGDYAAAAAQWRQLADRGFPEAQTWLARCYRYGRGVEKDLARSKFLLEQAAAQDYAPAYQELGKIYDKGIGVESDPNRAQSYFALAQKYGYPRKSVSPARP